MERIHLMELPPFSKGRQPSSKGDNLCDFLFAFLATKFHLKTRKHQKEENCSQGANSFLLM